MKKTMQICLCLFLFIGIIAACGGASDAEETAVFMEYTPILENLHDAGEVSEVVETTYAEVMPQPNRPTVEFITSNIDVNIPFIDEQGFGYLANIYGNIDFLADIEISDVFYFETYFYDLYDLLMGRCKIYIPEGILMPTSLHGRYYFYEVIRDFDPFAFEFYLLSFSGIGGFELGIRAERAFYVIRHSHQKGGFYLWYYIPPSWTMFTGTRQLSFGGGVFPVNHAFAVLDIYGNIEMAANFYVTYFSDDDEYGSVYLVSIPQTVYEVYIPQHLKAQATEFENNSNIFLRVTQEQFQLIAYEYNRARDFGSKILGTMGFCFDEIF